MAFHSSGDAIGLMRFTEIGNADDNHIQATTWSPAAGWSTLANIGAGITTQGAPTLAGGSVVHGAFHGMDFKYYYLAWQGTAISPVAEQVGVVQSAGPARPSIAALGADATLAFAADTTNVLSAQDRLAGVWASSTSVTGVIDFAVPPTLVALTTGPELMVVWMESTQIKFATRTTSTWSAPADITNGFTSDPVALAALPGGDAVLAFRGTDGKAYTALYTAGVWSSPTALATPNVSIVGSPALAPGIGAVTAEIAYVAAADTAVYHARLTGGVWSVPVLVGGSGQTGVALASKP